MVSNSFSVQDLDCWSFYRMENTVLLFFFFLFFFFFHPVTAFKRGPHGILVFAKCVLPSVNKVYYYYYYYYSQINTCIVLYTCILTTNQLKVKFRMKADQPSTSINNDTIITAFLSINILGALQFRCSINGIFESKASFGRLRPF